MRDASVAAQSHLKKHKVKHGIGCGVIITVAVVLGVVLGAVAAVVVYNKNQELKQATEQQKADSAKAASAAVNLGEISVLPPKKKGDDAASRRLFGDVHAAIVKTLTSTLSDPGVGRALRGLESSGQPINTASFDALSDYNTTTTATSVDDGMSDTLQTPNMIICMLSQTKAEKFFNKGPYIANVDENKCMPQGNSQDAGPRITPVSFLTRQTKLSTLFVGCNSA
jgi:hypothetical protein